MTAQNESVRILEELGFEIINNTETDLVCKIEPLGPEDGRWLDLSIDRERCTALRRIGNIIFVKAEGISGTNPQRRDEKPHLRIELEKRPAR